MAKALFVDENILSGLYNKDVVITIRSANNEQLHKFGPVTFLGAENQKSTGMKNAPEKRMKDGKAYTPPMITLKFAGDNNLVFVVEDFKLVCSFGGVAFIFDNQSVYVVDCAYDV